MEQRRKDPLLVLAGPTGVGKSETAVLLAQKIGGEVVSADSMQIYRRMTIGTAKPTPEEMQDVPHHMIDVAEPEENWSVARYVEAAAACVEDILARGRLPVIVGGTGLYFSALLRGLDRAWTPPPPVRIVNGSCLMPAGLRPPVGV